MALVALFRGWRYLKSIELYYIFMYFTLFFSILLSFVSGEDTQDRTDRVMLTPWVKFLWEAYRNVLELLRNNARVEKLYHDTAQQGTQST